MSIILEEYPLLDTHQSDGLASGHDSFRYFLAANSDLITALCGDLSKLLMEISQGGWYDLPFLPGSLALKMDSLSATSLNGKGAAKSTDQLPSFLGSFASQMAFESPGKEPPTIPLGSLLLCSVIMARLCERRFGKGSPHLGVAFEPAQWIFQVTHSVCRIGPTFELLRILLDKMSSTQLDKHIMLWDWKGYKASLQMTQNWEELEVLQRDLNKLEDWAITNHMKLNKGKCRILHLEQGNLGFSFRLGNEVLESSATERDLEVLINCKLNMSQQCPGSQEGQLCPGGHQAKHHQLVEGHDCPALLCSGAASP
ncbi:hypothetical protein WISP_92232 [Willisornis vidua]|uniref:Uncharacterized protein n=1 Tax=Willisornis vidua TaxID=1566151 RepID=A0ABQ9D1P5_9PASS|nr:hypothetical protein WISP_92232 [Willisornis vidua]